MALQSRGVWEKCPNRVFKAQFPFVCTLMWYVKKLMHYLLLLRSRFNMHQLLCMKFLLWETGLMIIFICAPPGIFNSISLLNKRDRLWELRWRCVMRQDNVALTTVCFHPGFDAGRPWPLTLSESAFKFSWPFLWYRKISLFQLLGPNGWISYCLLLE